MPYTVCKRIQVWLFIAKPSSGSASGYSWCLALLESMNNPFQALPVFHFPLTTGLLLCLTCGGQHPLQQIHPTSSLSLSWKGPLLASGVPGEVFPLPLRYHIKHSGSMALGYWRFAAERNPPEETWKRQALKYPSAKVGQGSPRQGWTGSSRPWARWEEQQRSLLES